MEKYEIIYKKSGANETTYCSCTVPMLVDTLANLIDHKGIIISVNLVTGC